MKTVLVSFFIGLSALLSAQSVDYNLDGGYVVEGYDVVSYFNGKAEEGSKKYVATYDNVKLKFSSQANLDEFKANPKKYLPQYGGYCAYAMATRGKKVESNPETFEIRNGKLYLFYNSWGNNTFKKWKKESPDQLVLKANKNWEKVKSR